MAENTFVLSETRSVSTDSDGNVYCAGFFGDSIDLDPTSGVDIVYNFPSNHQSFLQKFDASGNFIWARACPGQVTKMLSDSSGNVYLTGRFNGSIDFDLGPGINLANSSFGSDLYVIKYDSTGSFDWVYTAGNNSNMYPAGMAIDAQNDLVILGSFQGSVDLDPSSNISMITALDNEDPFLMKLDTSGNFQWAKRIGGRVTAATFIQFDVDQQSNIIVAGSFNTPNDFGQSSPSVFTPQGADIHIQKYDANGTQLWVNFISSPTTQETTALEVDVENNIYISGNYFGTTDFDPGPNVFNLPIEDSNSDIFLLKLDENSNFQWVRNLYGSLSNGFILNIESSKFADTIFMSGWTTGFDNEFDLNFGNGVALMLPGNSSYILAVDSTSQYLWSKSFFSNNNSTFLDLHLSSDRSLYLGGRFMSQIDFDPSPNQVLHNSPTFDSHFLLRLDNCQPEYTYLTESSCDRYYSNDSTHYFDQSGTYNIMIPRSNNCDSVILLNLSIDANTGNDTISSCDSYTWINGNTYTSSSDTITHVLTNSLGCDSLITLSLTINQSNTETDLITSCQAYTWIDGTTYTSSNNTATYLLTNSAGCDSLVMLDLIIGTATSGVDVISACDSYTWTDGINYSASNNTAIDTFANVNGCDSIVTLNLTINNSNYGTDFITACNEFVWIDGLTYTSSNNTATYLLSNSLGCDSLVTLDLIINNSSYGTDVITACNEFTWIDGITYVSSTDTSTFLLSNSQGCDSLVSLDLTINEVNTDVTETIVNSIIILEANAAASSYNWLDCNDGFSQIFGENGATFIPQQNGLYAVEILMDGCTDTSMCILVDQVGMENLDSKNWKSYPNPTDGIFTLDFHEEIQSVHLYLTNSIGQRIQESEYLNQSNITLHIVGDPGLYFLSVSSDSNYLIIPILKI